MDEPTKIASLLVDALNAEYQNKQLEGSDLLKGISMFLLKMVQVEEGIQEKFHPLLVPFHMAALESEKCDA